MLRPRCGAGVAAAAPIVGDMLETAYTGVLLLVLGVFAWLCLYVVYRLYTGAR